MTPRDLVSNDVGTAAYLARDGFPDDPPSPADYLPLPSSRDDDDLPVATDDFLADIGYGDEFDLPF